MEITSSRNTTPAQLGGPAPRQLYYRLPPSPRGLTSLLSRRSSTMPTLTTYSGTSDLQSHLNNFQQVMRLARESSDEILCLAGSGRLRRAPKHAKEETVEIRSAESFGSLIYRGQVRKGYLIGRCFPFLSKYPMEIRFFFSDGTNLTLVNLFRQHYWQGGSSR